MAKLYATAIAENVSLTASTAETVLAIQAPTNQAVEIVDVNVSFNGSTSTNAPALVEFGFITFATNGPGTNSTSVTSVKRDQARTEAIQTTAGKAWTAEPTVWTVLDCMDIAQFNGSWHNIIEYYGPIIAKGGLGFGIRINSPNNVSFTGSITFQE